MSNLVLGRKVGERIYINEDIIITISQISYGQVKLAIEAPKEVTILREEVRERNLMKQREEA
jgi:carbon storage regulator